MKTFKSSAWLSTLLFAAILLVHSSAGAQKIIEEYKKPMPDMPLLPQAEFLEKTTEYKDTPLGDKSLAYTVRLPDEWQRSKEAGITSDSLASKIMGEVIRFYGPPTGDLRSYFTVQSQVLDYRMTAEQWLIQYFVANSYALQGLKTYANNRAEALYVYNQGEESYIVRTMTSINGNRVILASYYLPYARWEDEKTMQAQTVESFMMTESVPSKVEPTKTYHFLDIAQFEYPASWDIHAEPLKSIDRVQVQLFSIASDEMINKRHFKTLNGKITVAIVSYYVVDTLDEEIRKFKNDIQKNGLMIQNQIETLKDFKIGKDIDSRPVEVYNTMDRENNLLNYELWLEVLVSGDYYYFITLLTPSRDEDYTTWSRNIETYRTLIETLSPQEGSISNED